jgi:CDP-diacylglycerol--serine O-phosphatidyltransferase
MKRMRPVVMLPTMVTLGNLFVGFLAVAYLTDVMRHDPTSAEAAVVRIRLFEKSILLIFMAMVFDTLDGFVARLTKQSSAFGAQVDSICDAVSFGAAPALLFKVTVEAHEQVVHPKIALVLAVIFLACGVLRLARFNLETEADEDSHRFFEGLPIPAAAAVVASLCHVNIAIDPERADSWVRHTLPYLMPVLGFLMVSRIPYVHVGVLLARKWSFQIVVLLVFVLAFAILFIDISLPGLCVGFALSGPAYLLFGGKRKKLESDEQAPEEPEPEPET